MTWAMAMCRVAAARHAPSCMMFRPPRRFNTVPTQGFRAQGCRPRPSTGQQCRSGFASGTYGALKACIAVPISSDCYHGLPGMLVSTQQGHLLQTP